ncbi:nucleotide-binding domain-containing protein [Venturia nashicola]|uniref:Nucleotide-binding domain-containing protein n=1 Tax=Venturia nashicola TaxID=86259 RepID=A0A4Z1P4Q8_9PEZI|nr:nucleotide-binding domain-containing protein [Venturia nashicola]
MGSLQKHVVVLGAGVVGLQTAISLLEAGYKATIVAKHFPGDLSIEYTSPWAGAHWRPNDVEVDLEQQGWDLESYNYWLSIVARELNEPETTVRSGLDVVEATGYYKDATPPWFSKNVLSFQQIGQKEIFGQQLHGHKFASIAINVPHYLQFLLDTSIQLGATTIRSTIPTSTSLANSIKYLSSTLSPDNPGMRRVDAYINATGISARKLVPDENVYPIRGQTVLVKGEAKGITTIDASPPSSISKEEGGLGIIYILPRPHSSTTILGGTKQAHSFDASPNPQTTKEILEAAKQRAPELLNGQGEFEVLSEQVGLRPGRKGGVRCEIEVLGQEERMVVCHAYGHGGGGFQKSIGCAKKVVRLLGEHFRESGKEVVGAKL